MGIIIKKNPESKLAFTNIILNTFELDTLYHFFQEVSSKLFYTGSIKHEFVIKCFISS